MSLFVGWFSWHAGCICYRGHTGEAYTSKFHAGRDMTFAFAYVIRY